MKSSDQTSNAARRRPLRRWEPQFLTVERGYELWAPTYDCELNPLLALEERVLLPALPRLDGKTVVDLACGTGRWLNLLLERGARAAVGVDISAAMLEQASAKPLLKGRLIRSDCMVLPLRPHAADFLLCSFAVGHVQALAEFAAEIARVMKPQGDLYVTDLHPEGYQRGWRTGFRHNNRARQIVGFPRSLESILGAFQNQGFQVAQQLEPHFSEAEQPIFVRAGREALFSSACEIPAVLICHFRQTADRSGAPDPKS